MGHAAGEIFDNGAVAATRTTDLIREYMTYLRVEKGLRPLSCAAYERDLLQFAEYLEGVNTALLDAGPENVSGFVQHLGRHGVESRSAARKLSCLRGLYKWLILDKRIARDPTLHQDSPSAWKVLPKALAPEEMTAMLEQAKAVAEGPGADAAALRDRAILELLYAGGLRVSELTGLRVADLNLEAGRALVRGKGDKERVVPLGEPAVRALEDYLERGRPVLARHGRRAESALFLSVRGARLTRGWVWQMVRRYGASPHMLRHSAATHMVEHGADLRTVQTFLGHADISTTQVYTHVALGHLKAEHRKFHPRGKR
jgi:integrase/recombinase XerD